MAKSVLIVDDDDDNRTTLARVLAMQGYIVSEAPRGAAGLEILRSSPLPDVVLLDWLLTDMTGWDFLAQLRYDPELAAVTVMVISGHPHLAEKPSLMSGVRFLVKPVEPRTLFAVLEELITQPPPEILVVDDEAAVGEVVAFGLRHAGFAVRLVSKGEKAVEVYQSHGDNIRLVLLDVQMPGMDGPQTLTALQGVNPRVKAVFMSGHTGGYSASELLGLGALRVLEKPLDLTRLGDTLRELF